MPDTQKDKCGRCHGSGRILWRNELLKEDVYGTCPDCHGTGETKPKAPSDVLCDLIEAPAADPSPEVKPLLPKWVTPILDSDHSSDDVKTHAVIDSGRALCGLLPRRGWSAIISPEQCKRCTRKLALPPPKRRIRGGSAVTHGHTIGRSYSGTYTSWQAMLARCRYPKRDTENKHINRGISVCEQWKVFENFLADMGERPLNKTLDRWPNNDGNYEPGNCRWATAREQARNTRKTRYVTLNGERRPLVEWSETLGISPGRVLTMEKNNGK